MTVLPVVAIVPVFNPEPGLGTLIESLTMAFARVVVVDDGSREHVEDFASLPSQVVLLRHDRNCGKGRAMKTALAWVQDNCSEAVGVVFVDGDGQHRIEDVKWVAEKMRATDRVVFGVRDFSRAGVPFRSWWGNRWTSLEVALLFGLRLADTQTGLRAVPKRLIPHFVRLRGERFEYESGWFGLLWRLSERIVQIPIETIYLRSNRASHFRGFHDTLLTQKTLLLSRFLRV